MENTWLEIDTAPKDGTPIIICTIETVDEKKDVFITEVRWENDDKNGPAGWYDNYGGDYKPDYWIPMPKMPVKKHECIEGEFRCSSFMSNDKRFLRLYGVMNSHPLYSQIMFCSFCPFCGEKA